MIPEKPSIDGLEATWAPRWEEAGIYRFDPSRPATLSPDNPREAVFSIDTPPPTVSGSLHVGHLFSYTHTDTVARYKRMRGFEVFYPMGWDDNGVPTERRVQNYYGVGCDPSLPYDPSFQPPAPGSDGRGQSPGKEPQHISRPNFVELCERLTSEDEKAFEHLWTTLGLSVDWSMTYATIDERSRRVSQRAFLRLQEKGLCYHAVAPTLWDVDFKMAVSQAELEDRERPGAYYRLRFARAGDGGDIEIDTTRPELLPACVALVAHPDDERYKPIFGTEAVTPLFGVTVPIVAHTLADPEKGTGIAMVCTFGDTTDVQWWRELGLTTRTIVQRDGRLGEVEWGSEGWECSDPSIASRYYGELYGRTVKQAQAAVVEMLATAGALCGEPKAITHPVKFYEKGDRPLEIVSSRQWFVRTLGMREELLERGDQLAWHPPYMLARYRSWVEGLNQDWNISRQRYFGVPFPVWYPVGADGSLGYSAPIFAAEDALPVDPSTDVPPGFTPDQRGLPGGFAGDPDVMDTWATSSLTPQIAGRWEEDPDLFEMVFPMDLRPQSHEIIRTWLFSTVVRSHVEHSSLPFTNVAISGWVLDPDRKKMSKSKGNVVTPLPLIEHHGADACRYWAASAHPGIDTAVDEGQMKVGRRLAVKILNASRFALSFLEEAGRSSAEPVGATASAPLAPAAPLEPLDASMLATLAGVVEDATRAFEAFDHGRALERTESFFWSFCDDYLELVKSRAYGEVGGPDDQASAHAALSAAISVLLRLFAPIMPFVTEEVWSWWQDGSVHRASWPDPDELRSLATGGDPAVLATAGWVIGAARKAKSEAKKGMRTPLARLAVFAPASQLSLVKLAATDIAAAAGLAGTVEAVEGSAGEEHRVEVELAEEG